jgi:serine/threonine protein kinase
MRVCRAVCRLGDNAWRSFTFSSALVLLFRPSFCPNSCSISSFSHHRLVCSLNDAYTAYDSLLLASPLILVSTSGRLEIYRCLTLIFVIMDPDRRDSNETGSAGLAKARIRIPLDSDTHTDPEHSHVSIHQMPPNAMTVAGDADHGSTLDPMDTSLSLSKSYEDLGMNRALRTEKHRGEEDDEQTSQGSMPSGPDHQGTPSREDTWRFSEDLDPDALLEKAYRCIFDILKASRYKESFETTSNNLVLLQSQLQQMLERHDLVNEPQRYKLLIALASISEELGRYEDSQMIYESLCPLSTFQLRIMSDTENSHKIQAFVRGLQFLVRTERDIYVAEEILKMLPWVGYVFKTYQQRWESLFTLIRALNYQRKYQEASWQLRAFRVLFPDHTLTPGALDLQVAISRSGEDLIDEANYHFVNAFVSSSLENGPWHRQTLEILLHFGKALGAWKHHDASLSILTESCKGFFYRFGPLHPLSVRAYEELRNSARFRSCPIVLRHLSSTKDSDIEKRSIAYEHMHLKSAVELIGLAGTVKMHQTIEIIGIHLTMDRPVYQRIEARRMLAHFKFQTKDHQMALRKTLDTLHDWTSEGDFYREILKLDTAIFATITDVSVAEETTLMILRNLEGYQLYHKDQALAIHRRLTHLGLTHFTQAKSIVAWILPSETGCLGRGSQASVDAVTIGTVGYARKSIFVHPKNQRSVREAIQNEVKNLKKLIHPHIVKIFLTYEEKHMFHIVMHPLAECDLETFLERDETHTWREGQLGWKWIGCLASTLAFIHSKGVRHKDIKPRNILVSGERILFSDFGSSHAFQDDGDSTTEGPAFGHTVRYCAPEVVVEAMRNRSADVFSLGCVFTELILWTHGYSVPHYHDHRATTSNGMTTSAYHATLDKVNSIFLSDGVLAAPFKAIIQPMIAKEPRERLTASEASKAISAYRLELNNGLDRECQECCLNLWVEDDADVDFSTL